MSWFLYVSFCSCSCPGDCSLVLRRYIGILGNDETGARFVERFVERLVGELSSSLEAPGDRFKAFSLLRCLGQLVNCGIIDSRYLWDMLLEIVAVGEKIASGDRGAVYQPYSDHLVSVALGMLPFAGKEFCTSDSGSFVELLSRCKKYVESRPTQSFENLRPFYAKVADDDSLYLSFGGAGGNLQELLSAIEEMQKEDVYSFGCIPEVHKQFENELSSSRHGLALPSLSFTGEVILTDSTQNDAVQILEWYPPRGIIRFLKDEHTKMDHLLIERIIAEDYFLHTMHYFEGDRVECAKRLARFMPLNYAYDPLLAETIFGQMLRLPHSEFKPVMYGTLMVDLCKLISTFPRPMSACVRECFSRMKVMDPYLRQTLSQWLAYHVSNYDFAWPWQRWSHVLDMPESDYQRRFCADVIMRMIRLSYWDRVNDVLPEEFRTLLPPKPQHERLPDPNAGAGEDLEGFWAARAVEMIRKKAKDEQLDDWISSNALEAVLGGKVEVSRMLLRALLVAGQKTYSHMIIALERYYGPLAVFISEGGEGAQKAAIDTIWQVWSQNIQRAVMAVDRMMTLRLISANAVVSWVFDSGTIKCTKDHAKYSFGWEALHHAVNKVVARVDDVQFEIDALQSVEQTDAVLESISAKKNLLLQCETQRSETVTLAISKFVSTINTLVSENGSLASCENVESLVPTDGSAPEEAILLYDMVSFAQAFIRHYYISVALCADKVKDIPSSAELFPITKMIMHSSICL